MFPSLPFSSRRSNNRIAARCGGIRLLAATFALSVSPLYVHAQEATPGAQPPVAPSQQLPGEVPALPSPSPSDIPAQTPVQELLTRYKHGSDKRKPSILISLLNSGEEGLAALRNLAETEDDETIRKTVFTEFANALQPQIPRLLAARRDDVVATGLYLGATSWTDTHIRAYISFEMWRNRLPEATAGIRKTFGSRPDAAMLLACMYRAAGDNANAVAFAEKTGDSEMLGSLLVEQGDWKREMARLKSQNSFGTNGILEGRIALVAQLLGDQATMNASLTALKRCVANGGCEPARAAAVFIQCDRTPEALEVLGDKDLLLRSSLEYERGNYSASMLILDRIQGIAVSQQQPRPLLRMLDTSRKLGLTEKMTKAVADLVSIGCTALQTPDGSSFDLNTSLDVWVNKWADAEQKVVGAVGYETTLPGSEPLRQLFPGHYYGEGTDGAVNGSAGYAAWWFVLRTNDSSKSPEQTLKQLEDVLSGKVGEAALCDMVDMAAPEIAKAQQDIFIRTNMGLVRLLRVAGKRGQAMAVDCLRRVMEAHNIPREVQQECARLACAEGMYAEAIQYYRLAPPQTAAGWLTLAQCYAKTGRPDLQKAAENRAQPLLMGLEPNWLSLLDSLQTQKNPAYRQWLETAYRVATPGSSFASQIRYRLAFALAEEGRVQEALKLWPGCVLSYEGVKQDSVSDLSWLRAQYHALRARALIAEKKYAEAIQAVRLSVAHRPYSPVGIDIVRQLEKEGCKAEADTVFDLYYQSRQRACQEFANSSSFQNDMAWLCANTHRHLDEALSRAERANALFTRRPELMDTLAEVYFQRGNKAKAEELLRLCVWMQPATDYFRLQQKRIQEDRKSDPPPEPSWMTELTGE
ncbi:MAG: tetratricopeptide repeat protein [Candidatus Methylacidiphilales bacterium]|nr:hypothetical protein [Candidatus Methylacidiphilales bacterium]